MANGPLGGFMPTPAAPAQPPQVKLDTTADSRGNFNNFLKNMNGATLVDPPVVAPVMGAMTPNMAPALANIDIFNQPVQMMFDGGEVDDAFDDFGDFSGIDTPSDTNEGASSDNIDDSSPDSDIDYTDVFTPDELQEATDIGRATSDSTSDGTTIANQNVKFTDLNQNQIRELKSQIANKNEVALAEEDKFFNKDGSMNQAGKDELNKRNAADLQLVSAGQVLPSEYLSTASDILGTGEKSVMDALDLDRPIDPFDIQPTVVTTPAAIGLPTVSSRFNVTPNVTTQTTTLSPGEALQRNVEQQRLAEAGRALGPTTFSDDLAGFQTRQTLSPPPEGFEEAVGTEGALRQGKLMFAPGEGRIRFNPAFVKPSDQIELRELRDIDEAIEVAGRGPLRSTTQTSAANRGLGTSGLTQTDIKNIQDAADRDLIARSVEDKSRQFQPSTNVFGFDIPNVFGRGLNALSNVVDRQVMKDITEKGFTPVYDRDGTITGSRDPNTGILMSGSDFSIQDRATSDNEPNQPLVRTFTPRQDEEKPDLPPNVIGGTGGQLGNLNNIGAIPEVASPFTLASSRINPITFDTGQLNKLIEMLTGVQARPVVSKEEGGLVSAVDEFLASAS